MNREHLEYYLADASRAGEPAEGARHGYAGGSACGDLVRISLLASSPGEIVQARHSAEGCAALRAAAAATCEMIEGEGVLTVAAIGVDHVAEALGGLGTEGIHAARLVADALHRALGAAVADEHVRLIADGGSERALVAMSGGVDSSVAAVIERESGAEVIGVTVKLWSDPGTDGSLSCCSPQAVLGARELAQSMGIPHFTLDLEDRFAGEVVSRFVEGYAGGSTPNPCVRCNGSVRIAPMIDLALRLGAGALVTGHYASVVDDGEGPLLVAADDPGKDQSYMLSALSPQTLARLRFPLAKMRKPEVREIAAARGLSVAEREESMDLCFLAGRGKQDFLERFGGLGERPGPILDESGELLGTHRGQHHYTVGQRKGLGLGGGTPLYVLERDAEQNTLIAGPLERLQRTRVELREATLHRHAARIDRVRMRYHAESLRCRVEPCDAGPGEHRRLDVSLAEPFAGVAAGQTATLMDGEMVVGHATIA